jgi:lipopolysaccharide transport protein LptA
MAPSLASRLPIFALALLLASGIGAQNSARDGEELVFESESLTFDRQSNMIQARRPRITQGDLRIAADEALATGIEFDQASEWRLTGRVRIEAGTAVFEADRAVFTFANEQLSRAELEGSPVSFSDVDEAAQTSITGRAQKMSYDYVARTLRMIDENAWVQKDQVEIQGCDLIYDFSAERVSSGSAGCEQPFRFRRLQDPEARATAPDPPQ